MQLKWEAGNAKYNRLKQCWQLLAERRSWLYNEAAWGRKPGACSDFATKRKERKRKNKWRKLKLSSLILTHSFFGEIFIEPLLCTRWCCVCWGYDRFKPNSLRGESWHSSVGRDYKPNRLAKYIAGRMKISTKKRNKTSRENIFRVGGKGVRKSFPAKMTFEQIFKRVRDWATWGLSLSVSGNWKCKSPGVEWCHY